MENSQNTHFIKKTSQRGFSFVEILSVVAIIAILVALISPLAKSLYAKANDTRCISNLKHIAIASANYGGASFFL